MVKIHIKETPHGAVKRRRSKAKIVLIPLHNSKKINARVKNTRSGGEHKESADEEEAYAPT